MIRENRTNIWAIRSIAQDSREYLIKIGETRKIISAIEMFSDDALFHPEEKQTIDEFIEFLEAFQARMRRENRRKELEWDTIQKLAADSENKVQWIEDSIDSEDIESILDEKFKEGEVPSRLHEG